MAPTLFAARQREALLTEWRRLRRAAMDDLRDRFAVLRITWGEEAAPVYLPAAAFAAAAALIPPVLVWLWMIAAIPANLPRLEYAMDRWAGVAVRDAEGCFLGLIPGQRDVGPSHFSAGHGAAPTDHKVIVLDDAPEGYWDVLLALENHGLGSWRTVPLTGIDWYSLLGSARDTLFAGRLRGASGVPQLVAGNLIHGDHGQAGGRIARKWDEFRYGAALYTAHWRANDPAGFRRLAANYLPHATSDTASRGGVITGVGAAAEMLWGVPAHELELWQQAVLAAAVRRPVLLGYDDGRNVTARWGEVRARAIYGLRTAYDEGHAEARRAIAQLEDAPLPQPSVCASLQPLLPDDPAQNFRVRFNPQVRAQYFAGETLSQAIPELRRHAGPRFNEAISEIRLTVSAAQNLRFSNALRRRLYAPGAGGDGARGMDMLFTAAAPDGRILLYHQPVERPLLDAPRATASVSKALAAVALARTGDPDDLYCNRRIDGVLRNAGGGTGAADCGAPGVRYRARHAFARSLNLPVFDALRAEPAAGLSALAAAAGFTPYSDTPASTALVFGLGEASPASMIAMINAIAAGATGGEARAGRPYIVDGIVWRSGNTSVIGTSEVDLRPWLSTPRARRYVGEVLGAPLQPGGTAVALGACTSPARFDIAKTGTVSVRGRISARLLTAAGVYRGSPAGFFAMAAHPAPAGAAPARLDSRMIASALCEAVRTAAPD